MKSIYLDTIGKRHSLYNELIDFPPEGYKFLTEVSPWDKSTKTVVNNDTIYSLQRYVLSRLIPVNLVKAYIEKVKRIPSGVKLTYSSGHIVFRKEPWITDCEYITHFAGYNYAHYARYRRIIEKKLADEDCKRIIPWTDEGAKTIRLTVKDKRILEKVETVNLAVSPKNFTKQFREDKVKLLFVGSANIPKDFDIKGGKEVVEAFSQLRKKYDDIELVIRSYVPQHIKQRCSKIGNVKIIEDIVPWSVLEEEFKTADIFLFPSHNTPGLAILDAMSYELPVITTDVWANHEMVIDGVSGFLIGKSKNLKYTQKNNIPNWSSWESLKTIKNCVDQETVDCLADKTSQLIEDKKLRTTIGRTGRKIVEYGKYSINVRNKRLKDIFDSV